MKERTDTTAFAPTARLVIPAPADPKSPAHNPNHNPWLILRRDHVLKLVERVYAQRNLPKHEMRSALEETLNEMRAPFPESVPFVTLRMNTHQDGLPHAIGFHESLDWVAAETVASVMHTASLDDVPPEYIQGACAWALPTLIETIRLSVRTMLEDAALSVLEEAKLTPRPTPAQMLAERQKIFEGSCLAPLPTQEYQLVLDLITAATPRARQLGLNPHQLFCDGRIELLIPHDKAVFSFQHLPSARQDNARRWLASALGWGTIYCRTEPDWWPRGSDSLDPAPGQGGKEVL